MLVCTSGTAGANFYPAVIEARESRVPLLVITADRPPELRDCHSGQTIDQVKLFGTYPNWQTELALPSLEMSMLAYLRQTIVHAWERSLFPTPGPVHLNIPFRDPLAPIPDAVLETRNFTSLTEDFFAGVTQELIGWQVDKLANSSLQPLINEWLQCDKGIIIAGTAQPRFPKEYARAIAVLSQALKWPILAEGLSPVRNYSPMYSYLVSTYDLILRHRQLTDHLAPKMVIQLGELPTSKVLRTWLKTTQPRIWVIDPSYHNLDPLHGKTTHIRISVEQLLQVFSDTNPLHSKKSLDLKLWCAVESKIRADVDETLANMNQLFEGKAAWLLSQVLPPETPLFIANSMPVRDVEFFWAPNNSAVQPFFNRGANGIDGTLSTALGIAHRRQSSVMLTGDLALLHDTNGFLLRNKFVGHLTIILINNNGGGIFEMLPIAKFDPPFEEFFATPQDINFAQLCATYNVEHELITSWEQMKARLNPLPEKGLRVLELQTNRKADAKWRQDNLGKFALHSI